jgi:hypothetical protein
LTLGGVPIPTLPALGLQGAQLEIINDNFPPGFFGFSVSNYYTVNTSNKVVVSVLRTNGSADYVTLQYTTKNGTAISNINNTVNDYAIASGTLNFPPGTISNGFTVTIENHATAQPTKYFNVLLFNPALNTGNGLTPFTFDLHGHQLQCAQAWSRDGKRPARRRGAGNFDGQLRHHQRLQQVRNQRRQLHWRDQYSYISKPGTRPRNHEHPDFAG